METEVTVKYGPEIVPFAEIPDRALFVTAGGIVCCKRVVHGERGLLYPAIDQRNYSGRNVVSSELVTPVKWARLTVGV